MGYYVNLRRSTVRIPADVKEEVLRRWKDLNKPENNHLKRGGSYSGGGQTAWWYSWMPADYDKTVSSPEEVLDHLGFEYQVDEDDGSIGIMFYDSKTGQEDIFFKAIADLIPAGQVMGWEGEDGAIYIWAFDGKEMILTEVDVWNKLDQMLSNKLPNKG